jgi:hypothetical protein
MYEAVEAFIKVVIVERGFFAGENVLSILTLQLRLPVAICIVQLGAFFLCHLAQSQRPLRRRPVFREDQLLECDDVFMQNREAVIVGSNRFAEISYLLGEGAMNLRCHLHTYDVCAHADFSLQIAGLRKIN